MDDDVVFKALADDSRRRLLDRLFRRDGQTLGELCVGHDMSRFGVMKHLRVLEAAHLITTRRVGREKHHFLNPVPIRRIHDRWVSKYTAPFAALLSNLKTQLEEGAMATELPKQVYEVFIRTTPEALWRAITESSETRKYFFGASMEIAAMHKGGRYVSRGPDGALWVDGEILEVEPPRRLVLSWNVHYDPAMARERSRVSWEIEPLGSVCKLTATHHVEEAPITGQHVAGGWPRILSSLKTLLETGTALELPPEK